jgi:hypothetical protein
MAVSLRVTQIEWALIEARLDDLEAVEGGYSGATRGILTLDEGWRVFVKIGVDDRTRAWARKEVGVYGRLRDLGFAFAPRLLSSSPDGTGFALEALTPQDGWDWSNRWSAARLECVLAATDDLAAIDPGSFRPPLTEPTLTARADGWLRLDPRAPRTLALYPKLEALGARDLIAALEARAGRRSSFSPRFDTLIHLDVRADNCAWRADTRDVGLVDWTWLQVGDRRLDHAALLTSVRHSGFDVTRGPLDRLDVEALTWMAGYWFAASTKPVWPGGPSGLRRHQFSMAITALRLAEELR